MTPDVLRVGRFDGRYRWGQRAEDRLQRGLWSVSGVGSNCGIVQIGRLIILLPQRSEKVVCHCKVMEGLFGGGEIPSDFPERSLGL
jgi:hypothetical protein